ncbi:transketolase [Candidatus Uhrbacteria bacterium]|nr:transketolase [Candidatus Uhrbacteria bacterium]
MTIAQLERKANAIRQDLIRMLLEAKSGHSAGPLGMAEVFTALYFGGILRHNPRKPNDPNRDRLFLSNGHICPIWYTTLAHAGYLPRAEMLKTLRKLGSRLQGHPHKKSLPPIENPSGPLGQGLSQAVGYALAAKMDDKKFEVFCVMSDGEHDEGQTWEAVLFAGKHKLANLTAIMDRNNIQIDGMTEDIMPLEPLRAKYEAFNWHVIEIDGNNIEEVIDACHRAKAVYEKPVMILAHTIPGKGVDFMEFKYEWHGKPPNAEEAKEALHQLRTLGGKIRGEHE